MGGMTRLGLWAGLAAACLLVAAFATRTESGARRLSDAYAAITGHSYHTAQEQQRRSAQRERELEDETRRLSDAVRQLHEERERLSSRIAAVERNYQDVTGSIGRLTQFPPRIWEPKPNLPERKVSDPRPPEPKASEPEVTDPKVTDAKATEPKAAESKATEPKNPEIKAPEPKAVEARLSEPKSAEPTAPATAPPAEAAPAPSGVATIPAQPSENLATPPELQEGVTARTQFALDLGGGPTMAALRTNWNKIRRAHARPLGGLRPVVGIRDGKSGQVELRLVVGPIANASTAARLCATLTAAGVQCLPTVFDGARLALR